MAQIKRRNNTARFSPANPFRDGQSFGIAYRETAQIEEAVVVDIVVNDSHPEYDTDGYNVGAVKFRFINTDAFTAESQLNWGYPLESNVTDYPLLNEIVLVIPALNRFYWTKKVNVSNRVTAQPLFGLNDSLKTRQTQTQKSSDYSRVADGGSPNTQNSQAESDRLGQTFVDKEQVFRLRSQEGDIIYEGRSGHSIRFGSNIEADQAPNIFIRCGPDPTQTPLPADSEFALVDENIDGDLSSIWITSDQVVPLTFATIDVDSHFKSVEDKPATLNGNQIIVNTDQLIFNTKGGRMLVSTFLGTHFTTRQDHTVDAEQNYKSFAKLNREIETGEEYRITVGTDYLLTVGGDKTSEVQGVTIHTTVGNHSIIADQIFIGSLADETEPLVLGDTLRDFIDKFLNIFIVNAPAFVLPTVGIGPLTPGVLNQIVALRAEFGIAVKNDAQSQGFLSLNNFVTRE